jgi:hypothetical protein
VTGSALPRCHPTEHRGVRRQVRVTALAPGRGRGGGPGAGTREGGGVESGRDTPATGHNGRVHGRVAGGPFRDLATAGRVGSVAALTNYACFGRVAGPSPPSRGAYISTTSWCSNAARGVNWPPCAALGGRDLAGLSPDGIRLLSGSRDRTVRLWDVSAGREVLSFAEQPARVGRVRVAADGPHRSGSRRRFGPRVPTRARSGVAHDPSGRRGPFDVGHGRAGACGPPLVSSRVADRASGPSPSWRSSSGRRRSARR